MKGHIWFVLTAFVLVIACNKEDYYGKSLVVEGADAACAEGIDIVSCEAISGCQAAYEDVESVTPVFASCIANPGAPAVPVSPPIATLPPEPVPVTPVVVTEDPPTIKEVYDGKCQNLEAKYVLSKTYSGDGLVRNVKKVKVCHNTGNGSSHTIIIACPALKAHIKHHDDEIGACEVPNP